MLKRTCCRFVSGLLGYAELLSNLLVAVSTQVQVQHFLCTVCQRRQVSIENCSRLSRTNIMHGVLAWIRLCLKQLPCLLVRTLNQTRFGDKVPGMTKLTLIK
jgi:hypothetical protein